MLNYRIAITFAYLMMGAFVLYFVIAAFAHAHDDTEDFAPWYRSLRNEDGMSCCSPNRDCKIVDTYRATAEGYEALYEGSWIAVPWRAVLQRQDNPTGHPVLCVGKGITTGKPYARCFIRGSEG